jgi:hypothetical protein
MGWAIYRTVVFLCDSFDADFGISIDPDYQPMYSREPKGEWEEGSVPFRKDLAFAGSGRSLGLMGSG